MPNLLTGSDIKDTYGQLLHIPTLDGTLRQCYSGTGTALPFYLSTAAAGVDNLSFDGNTIASTNTNGDINLTPNGTGAVVLSKATITTGVITALLTPLSVANGGTGSTTASAARTALGLGTIATQASSAVSITGGTMSGVSLTGSFTGITLVSSTTLAAVASLGYGAGAGSTVTQATSKSTGVTLNTPCGQITMHNATLNASTSVSFTLTNSSIAATDVVVVNISSGATASSYIVDIGAVAAGSCAIHLRNITAGNLSEAVVLNYVVIKGVDS